MLNHKRIGRQIKELRTLRNWKQYELADKVGLSRPAICNIENIEDLLNKHIASVKTDIEILPKPEKEKLKKQIKDIKIELDNLNYMFRKGRISASDYDIEYEELEKELKKIEVLTTSKKEIKDINKFFINDWKTIYNNLEKEKKRALWNSIIKNIVIDKDLNITIIFRS